MKKHLIWVVLDAVVLAVVLVVALAPPREQPAASDSQVVAEDGVREDDTVKGIPRNPRNNTPLGAAQAWAQAMVRADSKLMERVQSCRLVGGSDPVLNATGQ